MDRTSELRALLQSALDNVAISSSSSSPLSSSSQQQQHLHALAVASALASLRCPSAFIMRAVELRKSIVRTRRFAQEHLDDYAGYHRMCLGVPSRLDAAAWEEGAARLLAGFASEAAELQRSVALAAQISTQQAEAGTEKETLRSREEAVKSSASGLLQGGEVGDGGVASDTRSHYNIVVQQILEDLQDLSRFLGTMKLERNRYNINPLRIAAAPMQLSSYTAMPPSIVSDISKAGIDSAEEQEPVLSDEASTMPSSSSGSAAEDHDTPRAKMPSPASAAGTSSGKEKSGTGAMEVKASFADRYVAEMADPSTMRRYESFAEQHRELLSSERAEIKDRMPEELLEAESVERSVEDVAALLGEFSRILQSQSEVLEEVHTDSSAATGLVRGAEEQLDLTIERSKASQRTMIVVVLGLGFLLLLLDYITP